MAIRLLPAPKTPQGVCDAAKPPQWPPVPQRTRLATPAIGDDCPSWSPCVSSWSPAPSLWSPPTGQWPRPKQKSGVAWAARAGITVRVSAKASTKSIPPSVRGTATSRHVTSHRHPLLKTRIRSQPVVMVSVPRTYLPPARTQGPWPKPLRLPPPRSPRPKRPPPHLAAALGNNWPQDLGSIEASLNIANGAAQQAVAAAAAVAAL